MATTGQDPIIVHHFGLEVQQIETAYFSEVSGIDNETQIVETYQTDKLGHVFHQVHPGNSKWGQITLKRGIIKDNKVWEWRQQVIDGKIDAARADATLTGYGPDGTIVLQYVFQRAWPTKYQSPSFNAKGSEAAVETLVLAHEGAIRKK